MPKNALHYNDATLRGPRAQSTRPVDRTRLGRYNETMKHHLGIALQFIALVFLPMLIIWQLELGFRLIVMPALTLVAVVVFYIGYRLRES